MDLLVQTPGDFNPFKWLINICARNPWLFIATGAGLYIGIRNQHPDIYIMSLAIALSGILLFAVKFWRDYKDPSIRMAIAFTVALIFGGFVLFQIRPDVKFYLMNVTGLFLALFVSMILMIMFPHKRREFKQKGIFGSIRFIFAHIGNFVISHAGSILLLGLVWALGTKINPSADIDKIAVITTLLGLVWFNAGLLPKKNVRNFLVLAAVEFMIFAIIMIWLPNRDYFVLAGRTTFTLSAFSALIAYGQYKKYW